MIASVLVVAPMLCVAGVAVAAWAEDTYYRATLGALRFEEGELPAIGADDSWTNSHMREWLRPYASIEGAEVYIDAPEGASWPWNPGPLVEFHMSVRSAQAGDLAGELFVPNADWSGMRKLRFTLPAGAAAEGAREEFHRTRRAHDNAAAERGIPGTAWFRHRAYESRAALGEAPEGVRPERARAIDESDGVFDFMSGGRAVSENLQLDRLLPPQEGSAEPTVPIESLTGITIAPMDFASLLSGQAPATDPLAAFIPHDQHAVFFPSFGAMLAVADEVDRNAGDVVLRVEPRSESAMSRERYERQLCLSTSGLSRLLGPGVIRSVAITGSDPYFRTGTDVAVLFEAEDTGALRALLGAQIAALASVHGGAEPVSGEVAGVPYAGFRSPDRAVCTYLAAVAGVVMVTNSPVQIDAIAKVHAGQRPALATLDEYRYFRARYVRGEESAFIFLSDATIRRWCGPAWRIGAARRTQAHAVLSELTASFIDGVARADAEDGPIHTEHRVPGLGEIRLSPRGVWSDVYGGVGFQTPISELDVRHVTNDEAEAYERWRSAYQRNWRWAFDPIGLRLVVEDGKLAADLTVMPLILNTQYSTWVSLTRGASIDPAHADIHASVGQFVMAINRDSQPAQLANNFALGMAGGVKIDPIGWLGQTLTMFADHDPYWEELAAQKSGADRDTFLSDNIHRLPVAVRVQAASGFKLAAFLTALRAYVDQSSPGMTIWETRTHHDVPYVRVSASPAGGDGPMDRLAVYYAASADSLIVTLSEEVLKRAIDRKTRPVEPAGLRPMLGTSMCLQAGPELIAAMSATTADSYQREMQARAWGNLPILNEWRRRYPDMDPVQVHQRVWHVRLRCPGGGEYVWNEAWKTMESTLYGHPGAPKLGPVSPWIVDRLTFANFGLTFEEHGLRARAELERTDSAP